jgi:hypothetical protein
MNSISRSLIAASLAFCISAGTPVVSRAEDPPAPASKEALNAADALFTAQDWSGAEAAYGTLTKSNPKGPMIWFRYAFSLHAQGKFAPAADAYRKAVEFPQIRPLAGYNLACALAKLGDKEAAFAALSDALDAGFGDIGTLESDPDLASIRDDPRMAELIRKANPISSQAKEFAFWVGDWNVYNPAGQQVGTNLIESRENGCLIVENWTNMTKNTGTSFNFIDPVDRRWRQIWVDPGGSVIRYEGEIKDGVMMFEGTNTSGRGTTVRTRMSFTPNEDGTVRQFIEHSKDEGATWEVYFDGIYKRKT